MRKVKFLAFSMLVLFILALVPWVNGFLFKQNYMDFLSTFSSQNKIRLKVLVYHRGWLTSRVKIYAEPIQLDPSVLVPSQNDQDKERKVSMGVTIEQNISHGPIVYDPVKQAWKIAQATVISHVHLPTMLEMLLLNNDQSQSVMQVYTLADFKGDFQNHIEVPNLKIQIPGIINILWTGMAGDVRLNFSNGEIKQIKSAFNVGLLSAQKENSSLVMQPTSIYEDVSAHPVGLWGGRYTLYVPELAVSDKSFSTSFSNFNLQTSFGVDPDNLYNSAMDLSIGKLIVPQYDIQSAAFRLSVNYLNSKALLNIINTSYNLFKDKKNITDQMNKYSGLISQLITPKTIIFTDFALYSLMGNIAFNAQATWPVDTPLPMGVEDMPAKMNFQINARVPVFLVDQLIEWAAKKQAANYREPNVGNKESIRDDSETIIKSEEDSSSPSLASTSLAPEDIQKQVVRLNSEGKISLSVAIELQDLVNRKLSIEVFNQNIDRLVISKNITNDIATKLKEKYAETQNPLSSSLVHTIAQQEHAPTVSPVTAIEVHEKAIQDMREQIAELVRKGYLIQDNNDYVFSAVRQQGILQINGKKASALEPLEVSFFQ